MAAQQFTNALTPLLSNFSKEAAPANNAYEQIGAKGKSYRVGHFARFHTLRGIPLNQNLGETKTLWPVATTVADVRTICQEFDQNTDFEAGRYEYYYTPPLNNVPIKVHGNSAIFEPTSFDQMYPRQGVNIAQSQVDKLSAVAALKNDWAG
jgi:hypothetical protein